jgi:hypothetical protein
MALDNLALYDMALDDMELDDMELHNYFLDIILYLIMSHWII